MRTPIIHAIPVTLLGAMAALAAAPEQHGRAQTMSLIDADQKPAVEKSLRDLGSMSPAEAATTNKAVVTLVANQHSVAVTRGHNVVQDEPASVAGGALGPTPTDYFMVALGTCQNVVFVRYPGSSGWCPTRRSGRWRHPPSPRETPARRRNTSPRSSP
jgi:hypothetical protein